MRARAELSWTGLWAGDVALGTPTFEVLLKACDAVSEEPFKSRAQCLRTLIDPSGTTPMVLEASPRQGEAEQWGMVRWSETRRQVLGGFDGAVNVLTDTETALYRAKARGDAGAAKWLGRVTLLRLRIEDLGITDRAEEILCEACSHATGGRVPELDVLEGLWRHFQDGNTSFAPKGIRERNQLELLGILLPEFL